MPKLGQRIGPPSYRSFGRACALWIVVGSWFSGCATFEPVSMDETALKERMETQVQDGLTVTVAVPTRDEVRKIYGFDLASKGMQAVWVEVRNGGESAAWLLSSGLDPEYFSASEAAFPFLGAESSAKRLEIDAHFQALQFRNPVPPGDTASGFLVVNHDEGFKVVDIDLISNNTSNSFTFVIDDPSFKGDFKRVDFKSLYQDGEITELEQDEALREKIESLPCCTTNKKGTAEGDPLNLVVIGNSTDIFSAFIRRGWHATEMMTFKAIWRTTKSFLSGSRYRYSPISPLYVYGRPQDIALQKARGTIHQRNHLRLWMTPIRFRGDRVWVGQISRDIGVKLTLKSPTISTHVIDPDVDEARRYLIEDLAYSQVLVRLGYVKGVDYVSRDAPRYNLVGDPYFTDGLRATMFFEERPFDLSDINYIVDWESPTETRLRQKGALLDEAP